MIKIPKKNYYIGEFEVTQGLWKAVMREWKHSDYCENYKEDGYPMCCVSWNDCQDFIKKLNQEAQSSVSKIQRGKFRLPTEEEWEYAANGGQNFEFAGSNNLDEVGWYGDNSGKKTHSINETKQKLKANGYGLYNISGNVWEWCEDLYDNNGSSWVIRGGSWYNNADYCRSAFRNYYAPSHRYYDYGFRLALPSGQQ